MSTEWEKLCSLKVLPNWKDLGKRLGGKMKDVAKTINGLTFSQITDFMNSGTIEVCGFVLSKDDIVVKREFNGDTKRYEACVSDDGSLMVAIDTTCDEELYQELRSRTVISAVQKLRKASGMVVSDKVEIFFDVKNKSGDSDEAAVRLVEESLSTHKETMLKRLRTTPLPICHRSDYAVVTAKDAINDQDICPQGSTFHLYFTQPAVSVDKALIAQLCKSYSLDNFEERAKTSAMYLQTMDYETIISFEDVRVKVDGSDELVFKKGVHFFGSAVEKLVQ
jgi:isoleucyl-tRNA synthetase